MDTQRKSVVWDRNGFETSLREMMSYIQEALEIVDFETRDHGRDDVWGDEDFMAGRADKFQEAAQMAREMREAVVRAASQLNAEASRIEGAAATIDGMARNIAMRGGKSTRAEFNTGAHDLYR